MTAGVGAAGRPISPRRVLFLAYMFPPVGGGGVQRSLKFVKYLPQNGWIPTVLTVRPIAYYVYDPKLLAELPEEVEIIRSESIDPLRLAAVISPSHWRPGKSGVAGRSRVTEGSRLVKSYRLLRRLFFVPDAQVGWIPFAIREGMKRLRRGDISVIYSPGAPYSSAVAAYILSRLSGVPYVVDFRDGWTDDIYHVPPTPLHLWVNRSLERKVVTGASSVCVYGDWLAQRLAERYPAIAKRIVTIPNGFDPADLQGIVPAPRSAGTRRVVYSGSLFLHHRDVFRVFLQALNGLNPSVRERIEVMVIGQVYPQASTDVEDAKLAKNVQFTGYVSHDVALSYLASADASLLLVRKGDLGSVTGKVFELLMVGKPIIALAEPEGACAQILRSAGADQYLCDPAEASPVKTALELLVEGKMQGVNPEGAAPFNRAHQTAALAEILNDIVDDTRVVTARTAPDSYDRSSLPGTVVGNRTP